MENKERQILSEIVAMASVLRGQLEALEAKIAEFQEAAGAEEVDMTPIDLELDDIQTVEPVEETLEEPVEETLEEPVEEVVEEPVEEVFEEPVEEPIEEVVEEPVDEIDDDLPFGDIDEPVVEVVEPTAAPVALVDAVPVQAVIDSMTAKQAWRTDMPGSSVRDIRSAISLNDRILFINTLFGQDPMAFQECLTRINQLETLDEAVEYVASARPEWDFESEVVYRFMMAVRRKVK